jgi:hypothetical protein
VNHSTLLFSRDVDAMLLYGLRSAAENWLAASFFSWWWLMSPHTINISSTPTTTTTLLLLLLLNYYYVVPKKRNRADFRFSGTLIPRSLKCLFGSPSPEYVCVTCHVSPMDDRHCSTH